MNKANRIYIDNSKARINILRRKNLNALLRQLRWINAMEEIRRFMIKE